jgi:hypothetical protein
MEIRGADQKKSNRRSLRCAFGMTVLWGGGLLNHRQKGNLAQGLKPGHFGSHFRHDSSHALSQKRLVSVFFRKL